MAKGPLNLPFELSSSGLREYWRNLSRPVQLSVVTLGIALVVALVMIGGYLSRPSMEVLFRGMDARQAREVSEKLDELGITYELAEDGTALMVPREERDRLRLQLSPDLYAQGAGFALFEGNGVMMSDFERRRQWQIALQEELRRTIVSIDAVQEARVHLVLPEPGVFLRDQGTPSASVWLRLSPLVTLSEKQIKGILYLVAGSVENLKPENISLVDAQGNVLYDAYNLAEGSAPQAGVGEQMKLKREFERELESRIKSLLERVYGAGKAVAMVSAELDFDRKETTSVSYDDPVPRSEQRIEEQSSGEGHPGVETGESNIPGYDYNTGTGTGEYSYERIEEVVNYEVGEVRTYLAEAPGKIMRLSAAVIVDGEEPKEDVIQQVEALVATAIGQDLSRGDTVSVQMLPFEEPELGDLDEALKSERLQQYIRYGLMAGAGLLVFILVLLVIQKRPWTGRSRIKFPDQAAFDELELETEKVEQGKRDRLRRLADEEPEALAQLIKPWLVED